MLYKVTLAVLQAALEKKNSDNNVVSNEYITMP